ncbi:MAG: FAD-binding protein [Ruminococcaceae bacterium]|nr:FAD-binding protein [Oscillospiraceae bacterium]
MYDVAIIGAGPAGAVLALELAKADEKLKILLVDGSSEHGKVCGGLLSPDAKAELSSMGLTVPEAVITSPQTSTVDTIDLERGITRIYGRDYLNMDRAAFDSWLVSLIPDTVEIRRARCVSVEKSGNEFDLRLKSAGKLEEIKASIVVGADGAASIVRRSVFPNKKTYKYVSIQEWYEIPDKKIPVFSCIYDEKTSDSCSWTIIKDDNFIFGGAFLKDGCRRAFAEQKSRLEKHYGVRFGTPRKQEACLVVSPRRYGDFFVGQDGAYLVGEAAGFISSSSFEGISSAIRSGRMLARAISSGRDKQQITKKYQSATIGLRFKLLLKIPKMKILTSPTLRHLIMKSGVTAKKSLE